MDDSLDARKELAGRLYRAGGRPISPDDPIFDVVFIAREVARDEHARSTRDLEQLAAAIAESMARENVKLKAVAAETRNMIEKLEKTAERLEAAEAARKENGPTQVGLLVTEINKLFAKHVQEAVSAVAQAGK